MVTDVLPLAAFTTEALAYIAVVTAMLSLTKQGYDIFRQRKREHREIEEALDRQPYVREQLQLGNVGAAVEQLTAIIDQMAKAKIRDDEHYLRRIDELERELRVVEAESRKWEVQYRNVDERCRKITAVLRRHNWDVDEVT